MFQRASASMPFTVSQLTGYLRRLLEADPELCDVWVEGEISNASRPSSGHFYFTLKDAGAQLRGVMWKTAARQQLYLPRDGDRVLVHGHIGVYETGGVYQLYADVFQPAGAGDLNQQFERLKARLEAEGLFDPARKRSLPRYPRCIGVVTSPTAAALRDILNVLSRRYPLASVLLAPATVQGEAAPPQIVAALEALNARNDVDVVIVARGGGSLEELWAFNDERVARAVAASRLPVICGVGHEVDFSLADFAADVRAPTPSAAAELATPDRAGLYTQLLLLREALTAAGQDYVAQRRRALGAHVRALQHLSPAGQLGSARQRLDDLGQRARAALEHGLRLRHARLSGLRGQLDAVGPLATLERGYAIVRRGDGTLVYSAGQVAPGDVLQVQVCDGEFGARVIP